MTAIDATGFATLEELADQLHSSGRTLILCGAREQPARVMAQQNSSDTWVAKISAPNVAAALARAEIVHREIINAHAASAI